MSSIAYDPTNDALYRPEARETLFVQGGSYALEQLASEMARLAYVRFDESGQEGARLVNALGRVGFTEIETFGSTQTGTQAFAAVRPHDGQIVVSFRGTQPDKIRDLITDVKAVMTAWQAGGSVHRGFAEALVSIQPELAAWLNPGGMRRPGKLMLVGHSLGAALATLAASQWKPDAVYTFGSPRVGDAGFASTLDAGKITRFVDCCDVVTRVPPPVAYVHIGALRYIDRNGAIHDNADDSFIRRDGLVARVMYAVGSAFRSGRVPARELADHSMINYMRALWA